MNDSTEIEEAYHNKEHNYEEGKTDDDAFKVPSESLRASEHRLLSSSDGINHDNSFKFFPHIIFLTLYYVVVPLDVQPSALSLPELLNLIRMNNIDYNDEHSCPDCHAN
jgi:hypothetical protein